MQIIFDPQISEWGNPAGRTPRVSMYSGYRHVNFPFAYGAFTLSGRLSQNLSARIVESIMRSEPRNARTPVWPLSISLAATLEIDVSFSSSGYLDVSVHRVPFHTLWIGVWMTGVLPAGFPHSDIRGSSNICFSPRLFAAYHVFRRLLVPRHGFGLQKVSLRTVERFWESLPKRVKAPYTKSEKSWQYPEYIETRETLME